MDDTVDNSPSKLNEQQDEIARQVKRLRETDFKELNAKFKAFGLEYIIDYNHRRAAESAKFPADRGIKLLRDPIVSAYICWLQETNAVSNFITADFIRTQYLNILPRLMGEVEIPMVNGFGETFEAKKFHASESISALREMARSTKFYEDGSGNPADAITAFADFLNSALGKTE